MAKIFVPSSGADDWQQFLAKPETQWKTGYSARTMAHSWETAQGLPLEIDCMMSAAFGPCELLMAMP